MLSCVEFLAARHCCGGWRLCNEQNPIPALRKRVQTEHMQVNKLIYDRTLPMPLPCFMCLRNMSGFLTLHHILEQDGALF